MRGVLFFTLMIISQLVHSQQDTSVTIESVTITEQQLRGEAVGSTNVNLQQAGESLSSTMIASGIGYMKHYGAGSLATPSIRGGSANHTLLLWNGVPIISPTLGLVDFSLVPSGTHFDMSVQRGGSTALWGSGAVSGSISLTSSHSDDYNIRSGTAVGSYGMLRQSVSGRWQSGKWSGCTSYSHESADRDFTYETSASKPLVRQRNAAYHRNHLLQDLSYQLTPQQRLTAHLWVHLSATEIPPLSTQTSSTDSQDDAAIRAILGWQYTGHNTVYKVKASHIIDYNTFYGIINVAQGTNNTFTNTLLDATVQHGAGRHQWLAGATARATAATTQGYEDGVREQHLGAFVSHKWTAGGFQLQSTIRQDVVAGSFIPVVPSIGMSYHIWKHIQLRGRLSRDYRLPTLNDRYWSPGGNEDLMPESGWSYELGSDWTMDKSSWSLQYAVTAFYRSIDNWILWLPAESQPFWTAKNINSVVSQGLEQQLTLAAQLSKKSKMNLVTSYNYTRSEYQSALSVPRIVKGDQLLYTPIHQATLSASYTWAWLQLSALHVRVGETRGVNATIDSYNYTDVNLAYQVAKGKYDITVTATVANVGNQRYFVIERRPLPGRNYQLAMQLEF